MAEEHWTARAACRGVKDPEIFFPKTNDPADTEPAMAYCRRCPVLEQCRAEANAAGIVDGVWAGVDREVARREYRREQHRASEQRRTDRAAALRRENALYRLEEAARLTEFGCSPEEIGRRLDIAPESLERARIRARAAGRAHAAGEKAAVA